MINKVYKKILRKLRQRVKMLIKRFSLHKYYEDYTTKERRKMWPPAKPLSKKHICNCRLIEDRIKMLEYLPKNAFCAEIGIAQCNFSEKILKITHPSKLHLIDTNKKAIEIANKKFNKEINGRIVVHHGNSSIIIQSMPEKYFDWVYIDGDHSYSGVKKDLESVRLKLKPHGLIALNDYVFFGTSGLTKIGVIEAVNEFCINYDYEIIFLALQGRMYNDVVIKKIQAV